ncbi:hypothetical protein GIB67_005030, partial [Kingdonia uniflora]
ALQGGKKLGQTLSFENQNAVLDSVPTFFGLWGNTRINQQGLPAQFCDLYQPKNDVMVNLVDEKDEECQVKFKSGGFSAGWTGFSTAHNPVDGDALVFQLVKDAKFQVMVSIALL